MGNQNTTETTTIKTEPKESTVLVILDYPNWLCAIPASHFDELFSVSKGKDDDVCELQLEKFQGWYGGWETYLKSYRLRQEHPRMKDGDYNINLVGVYYLFRPK